MNQDAGKSMPPAGDSPSLAAGLADSGGDSVPDAAQIPAGTDANALGKPEQADGAHSFAGFFAPDLPEGRRLFLWFFLAMLLFSLYLLFSLLHPFLHSIILACVFTAICHPLYQNCLILTGNRRVPAALIVLFGIALLLTVLIVVFVAGLIPQAKTTIAAVNQWLGGAHLGETLNTYIEPLLQTIQEHFPEFEISIKDIHDNLTTLSTRAGQHLLGYAYSFVGNTLLFFAHTLLVLLIMFFLFIDGGSLVDRMSYLFPMKAEQTAVMIESLRRMSRAVLVGGFSVAVLQGIVGGIGLALVGIPALFWGAVMAFAALVPVVGTGLVWGPAVIFLLIMGRWQSALFLALWCGVGVTSIDSFLRPYLLRGGAKVPVLFLFMAILGGVNVFGMLGILYGPMILGLVAVMLDIYAEEYHDILQNRFRNRP
jgi:predicted PurR-regulated permease PerM